MNHSKTVPVKNTNHHQFTVIVLHMYRYCGSGITYTNNLKGEVSLIARFRKRTDNIHSRSNPYCDSDLEDSNLNFLLNTQLMLTHHLYHYIHQVMLQEVQQFRRHTETSIVMALIGKDVYSMPQLPYFMSPWAHLHVVGMLQFMSLT